MEECGEILQEGSKALRFGINDRFEDRPSVQEKMVNELNDLHGVLTMLIQEGIIPRTYIDPVKVQAKIQKIETYMLYAKEKGTLSDNV